MFIHSYTIWPHRGLRIISKTGNFKTNKTETGKFSFSKLYTFQWGGFKTSNLQVGRETWLMLKLAQQNKNLSCFYVIFHRKNCSSATQKYGTDSPENVTSVTSVFVVVIHTAKMHKCVNRYIRHCYKKY